MFLDFTLGGPSPNWDPKESGNGTRNNEPCVLNKYSCVLNKDSPSLYHQKVWVITSFMVGIESRRKYEKNREIINSILRVGTTNLIANYAHDCSQNDYVPMVCLLW